MTASLTRPAFVLPAAPDGWPEPMHSEAFSGWYGDFVDYVTESTEAAAESVLAQLLAVFGVCVGRSPYISVGLKNDHRPVLNVVLVGQSAKARKGTSWQPVRALIEEAEPSMKHRIMSGIASGQAIVDQLRDRVIKTDPLDGSEEVIDEGAPDKRLQIVEEEFTAVLKRGRGDTSTLTETIREGWDGGILGNVTKGDGARRATDATLGIIGHVTKDDLLQNLSSVSTTNGVVNRFLWIGARRTRLLSRIGDESPAIWNAFVNEMAQSIVFGQRTRRVNRNMEADDYWHDVVYQRLGTEDFAGTLGDVVARGEPYVARLSLVFALLNRSNQITVDHIQAAQAVWQYSVDTAAWLFGADTEAASGLDTRLLDMLRSNGRPMSRTEIRDALGRNVRGTPIAAALDRLREKGVAYRVVLPGNSTKPGRKPELWAPRVEVERNASSTS